MTNRPDRGYRDGVSAPTDFEALGFRTGVASPAGRSWLLTVDFEAFTAETLPAWSRAMSHWAKRAAAARFRFSIFIALENVVALRETSRPLYEDLTRAAASLDAGGTVFYPHNHYIFDIDTGERPGDVRNLPARVPGYHKRPSMFYDVVHRHGANLADWLVTLRSCHARFLDDAGIEAPARAAFRAGGWDYGSSPGDIETYVEALRTAGFSIDSSAVAGEFGTPTWQVGSAYGSNVFWLVPGLLEVAPCWSVDCGAPTLSRESASSLRELLRQRLLWSASRAPGALVTVLHFDHLFRRRGRHPADPEAAIDRFFTWLGRIRSALGAESITFDELELADPPG